MAAAEEAVIRARNVVADMAYFTARDDKPAGYCQAHVRNCDVYVGLIGLRYGPPVQDRPDVSYVELEFEAATEARLPRLVFMLDEDAALPIPPSWMLDSDPGLIARQRAFRDRLGGAEMIVPKVDSPERLELLLFQGLQALPGFARRIFISYRRDETAYAAKWLYGELTEHFGESQVFIDVATMEPGDKVVEVITTAVGSCGVLLALIGNRWLTITDAEGKRRIDDPNDFVRLEIATALARNDIRVIPILTDGARMPRTGDLPTSIAELASRHALEFSPDRLEDDLRRLIELLRNTSSSSQD